MSENYQASDKSSLHKYRTEIPNIIFDLGLDPYALSLYLHYKKVAGDHGKCFQKKSTISAETGISSTTIKDRNKVLTQPRQELNGKSLITITQRVDEKGEPLPTLVEINDIWPENFQILFSRFSGDGGGSPKNGGGSPNVGKQEEPFKQNNKQQTEAVAVFACLLPLDISQEEKEWITRNHTEEHVKHAVQYVTSPGFEIKTSLVQCLKWACKEQPKIKKTATATQESNQEWLDKNRHLNNTNSGEWKIIVGTDYIEFTHGQCCKVFHTSKPSFKEDVIKMDTQCRNKKDV